MLRLPPVPDFPHLIRQIRQAHGMSHAALARQLHVVPSTVHRWAMGDAEPLYRHGAALVFLAGNPTPDDRGV